MDRIRSAATLAAPVRLDSTGIDQVLRNVAARLDAMNPGTIMSAGALHSEVQLAVWEYHGIYNDTIVGRDINTVLGAVRELPLVGTRAEYAMRIHLMLGAVSL